MAIAQDRLFETRANQLAIVHLTRRRDISILQEPYVDAVRLDLLVSLLENGQDVKQYLAVEVKALSSQMQAEWVSQQVQRQRPELASLDLPLCLFLFSMEDDQGYWQWLREPDNDCPDSHCLRTVKSRTVEPLTDAAISQALETVRRWYARQRA